MGRLMEVDYSCVLSPTFSIVSISVNAVVCSTTIFGNLLILISIFKYPKQFKGSLYIFIGNLAASDLLLGLWLFLFILEEVLPEIELNWYFCLTKPVGIVVSYCCSILSLTGISLDRFMAVMLPLNHIIKAQKRGFFIKCLTVTWVISVATGSYPVIVPGLQPPHNKFICRLGAILPRHFDLIILISVILFICVNFSLYGVILRKIKTRKNPRNNCGRKNQSKTILMLIVLGLFVVCWLPFMICQFLLQVDLAQSTLKDVLCAREYFTKLAFINSAFNWIIYGYANRKFRTAFRKILCCDGSKTFGNLNHYQQRRQERIQMSST